MTRTRPIAFLATLAALPLTVVALADSLADARDRAYRNVNRIRFDGMSFRRDLAQREVETPALR